MLQTFNALLPEDLQSLMAQLQEEKYTRIESLGKRVHADAVAVQINDTHDAARRYSGVCVKAHQQVTAYLRMHRLVIIPYISDLIEKDDVGHDCEACGGGCSISHSAHITEIREAHFRMKEVLSWLQDARNEVAEFPEGWHALQSDITLLETAMTELFLIEESKLIPMIIELHKNIGAHA